MAAMFGAAQVTRRRALIAVGICGFAYLYVFPYQPKINNPNENVRFYMTAALVEEGTYTIDGMRKRWGWVNDAAVHDGHVYSVKAPGTSLLGLPGYAGYLYGSRLLEKPYDRTTALWVCRVTASIVPTLLWLFFLYLWLGSQASHPLVRDCVFASVALGSLLYGYGMLFVSHSLSAVAGFGAFMMLYRARRERCTDPGAPSGGRSQTTATTAFFAGLLTAAVTLFEYPGLIASALLALYGLISLRPWHRLMAFAAGGSVPTALMMHFQASAFGSPLTPGHLMVENEALRTAHYEGMYGAVGPTWEAFYGLLLAPEAGLLPLTPVLAFALVGFVALLKDREQRLDAAVALAICVLTALAICSMNNWRGGWTIGPRYLAVIVPFLAWAALTGLDLIARFRARTALALALGCTVVAIVASGVPSAYYPHLPPELSRPLPQLFRVLIAHDYAPFNAGAFVDAYGTRSMWPLLVAPALLLYRGLSTLYRPGDRLKVGLASAGVALCLLLPLWHRPQKEPGVAKAVAFITQNWSPEGHDRASELQRKLARSPHNSALRQQLVETYEAEGRRQKAQSVGRQGPRRKARRLPRR